MRTCRILLSLLLLFCLLMPVVALQAAPETAAWTVMLYLCGTDLESEGGFASDNILEIMDTTPSDQVQVVMETGGTAEWQLEGIDAGKRERFALVDDDFEKVESLPLASMGSPDTLAEFLQWGTTNYPAERTMVILWNHGGGSVHGIAWDELHNDDCLSTQELIQAFSTLEEPLEVIGFDACLMATLEMAAALQPYGRYMVASEETEPGGGWAYTEFLNYLAGNPQADGEDLGKVICDSFLAKCESMDDAELTTLSVVDLSEIPGLVTAFDAMADEMTGVTGDIDAMRVFSTAAKRTENYGGNTPDEGYYNLVDLGDLVMKTQSVVSDTAIGVLDALFRVVKYQVSGDLRGSANGLSVFFPLNTTADELEVFGQISPSENYTRFTQAFSQLSASAGTDSQSGDTSVSEVLSSLLSGYDGGEDYAPLDAGDYEVDFVSYIDEDYAYTLEITESLESVESVEFTLYYLDHDYNEYMELGYDNDLYADWDTGVFQDNFTGYWPCLGEEALLCAPYLIGEGEDYNLYSIPILLNGEQVSLRAAYIWDGEDECFRVLGAWRGMDEATGMSDRNLERLTDGDIIQPLFYSYAMDTGEELLYSMGELTVDGELSLFYDEIDDGEYLFQYEVSTVFGETFYSEAVIMEIQDDEISVRWEEDV